MKSLATAWHEVEPEYRRFIITLFVKMIALLYWIRALALSLFAASSFVAYKTLGSDTVAVTGPDFISREFLLWTLPFLFGEPYSFAVLLSWQLLLMGLCFAAGVGLYKLRNWGRILTLILTASHWLAAVAASLMFSSQLELPDTVGMAFGLAIQAAIVLFLLHPGVKQLFKQQEKEGE